MCDRDGRDKNRKLLDPGWLTFFEPRLTFFRLRGGGSIWHHCLGPQNLEIQHFDCGGMKIANFTSGGPQVSNFVRDV